MPTEQHPPSAATSRPGGEAGQDHAPGPPGGPAPATRARPAPPADPVRHRRRAWLLLAAAAWNLWLWTTRISNLATDEVARSTGFVAVHLALYAVSLGFTAAFAVVGWRMWRESRLWRQSRSGGRPGGPPGPSPGRAP